MMEFWSPRRLDQPGLMVEVEWHLRTLQKSPGRGPDVTNSTALFIHPVD